MSAQVQHTKHKLTTKVKDESFSIDNLQSYNLYLNIGEKSFQFCIVDTKNNKCVLLEEYNTPGLSSEEDLVQELQNIWDGHHLLQAGFWKKVRVSFKNQYFTLIPNSLYSRDNHAEYAQFFEELDSTKYEIGAYKHLSFSGVNVFAYPKDVISFLEDKYPKLKVEITHQSSCLIEAAFRGKTTKDDKDILLNVEENNLTLIVAEKGQLQFCNRFYFTASEDFIYYIMLMYKELGLKVNDDKLQIFGEIAPNSPLYDSIYKYIRHSSFGKRPKFLTFSYHFDEVFDHKFLNAYAIHLCE